MRIKKKPGGNSSRPISSRTMVNIEREQLSTEVPPLDESVWSNNVASDLYSFLEVMTQVTCGCEQNAWISF